MTGRPSFADVTPAAAAAGGLDDIAEDDWPMLAAYWMATGFDSPALLELAVLRRSDRAAARELMPVALSELGWPLVDESVFAARCQQALDVVQRDLDATGHSEFRMIPGNATTGSIVPTMYASVPGRGFWSGGSKGMRPEQDDRDLLYSAAESVSDTLLELFHINWPGCPMHAGYPMRPDWVDSGMPAPIEERDGRWWWHCRPFDHPAAPIGALNSPLDRGDPGR